MQMHQWMQVHGWVGSQQEMYIAALVYTITSNYSHQTFHQICQELALISSLVHKTCMAWHRHSIFHQFPAAETGGIKMGLSIPLLCCNYPYLPYPPFPVLTMTMAGVYPVTGHR